MDDILIGRNDCVAVELDPRSGNRRGMAGRDFSATGPEGTMNPVAFGG